MATFTPLLPGLPDLAPIRKGRRRCAPHLQHGWTLTPLLAQEPTPAVCDFLAFWHARVWREGEHAGLWGQLGLSPSHFVLTFAHVPFLVVHHDQMAWSQPDGLMMVVWLDDIVAGVRARCHQWVAPAYRHPRVSHLLGQGVLRYLFEEIGFQLLEGRTPVGNHQAVRYARRLGFQPVATLPYGEWDWAPDGTKTLTAVVQSQLTIAAWRAAHVVPPVNGTRPEETATYAESV